jgi:outer membrane protein OmpA-like peptidoglycan-associated protein
VLVLAGLVAVQAFVVRPVFDTDDAAASALVAGRPAAVVADTVPPSAERPSAEPRDATGPTGTSSPVSTAAPGPGPAGDLLTGLPPLTFVAGSDELTPESRTVLPVLAQRIASAPAGTRFEIRTHTDTTGDAGYNQWLSEQRAAAVCDGLIHAGVPRDRLTIVGVGESSPLVAPETTEADRAANRRVEVVPLS